VGRSGRGSRGGGGGGGGGAEGDVQRLALPVLLGQAGMGIDEFDKLDRNFLALRNPNAENTETKKQREKIIEKKQCDQQRKDNNIASTANTKD
jgi:hypothetical protein